MNIPIANIELLEAKLSKFLQDKISEVQKTMDIKEHSNLPFYYTSLGTPLADVVFFTLNLAEEQNNYKCFEFKYWDLNVFMTCFYYNTSIEVEAFVFNLPKKGYTTLYITSNKEEINSSMKLDSCQHIGDSIIYSHTFTKKMESSKVYIGFYFHF